jgi:DNA-binding SARP family transcriptional activator
VAVFEETAGLWLAKASQDMGRADPSSMENALELYTGDLLEGFYDDWAIRERERLRSLYLKSLARLMQSYRYHGDYDKSLACGHRLLDHEPLREEIHREMMRLYMASGRRASAIRQFRTCCRVLKTELEISPSFYPFCKGL